MPQNHQSSILKIPRGFYIAVILGFMLILGGCTADLRLWGGHAGKDPEGFFLPLDAPLRTVGFDSVIFELPYDRALGRTRNDPFCILGRSLATREIASRYEDIFTKITENLFYRTMQGRGFRVVGAPRNILFDRQEEEELSLAVIVTQLRYDDCRPWSGLGILSFLGIDLAKNTKAYVRLDIEWQLYETQSKKILYRAQGKGKYRSFFAYPGGGEAVFQRAMRRAFLSLSEDETFRKHLMRTTSLEGDLQ